MEIRRYGMRLDDMDNNPVLIEVPLPDGTHSYWLGRVVEVTPTEINLDHAVFVSHMGRRHKFVSGEYDETCELEPYPPEAIQRLPRWGAMVCDWLHPIPRDMR
jgi:hypothetical protein